MELFYFMLATLAVTSSRHIDTKGNAQKLDRIGVASLMHQYVDTHGRARIFHGTNAVNKEHPYYFDYLLDDSRLDDLQKWGFNILRLGAMWNGVEPQRDQYNQTYIDVLKEIVEKLASRGIYTMLDMHQDVMSTRYHAYDGIPLWLVETYPEATNPYPWPLNKVGYWEEAYATQVCSEGFEYFYTNYNGSVDKWVDFWGHIADNFKDNPNVIGYDLINEPWIGDYISRPELLLPGLAGAGHLVPAYDRINARIRQADTEGIIFFEPMIYGQAAQGVTLGSGFKQVPGGQRYANVSSYNFHMYCWALEFLGKNPSDEDRRRATEFCHKNLFPQFFEAQRANTKRFGGPAILSEFGLCKTHGEEINVECRVFMDLADDYFVSWNQWDMARFYRGGRSGEPNLAEVTPHVRTYAMAVAGVPLVMKFVEDNLDFWLEFKSGPMISAPTEIFVPSLRYKKGYSVVASDWLRYEADGDILKVYYKDPNHVGPVSSVRITAKK